jgi:hypothetical protein
MLEKPKCEDDSGWWVPDHLFGIHKFVNMEYTKVGGKYERPKKADVHVIGYADEPARYNEMKRIWRISDCVAPGKPAMYQVTLSWGDAGSLELATDGIYYLPLSNRKNDEWRWEQTTLGKDAGDIIIAEILKRVNEKKDGTDEDTE